MKLDELQKTFYEAFSFISIFNDGTDDIMVKKNLKEKTLKLSKEDLSILQVSYDAYDVKTLDITFNDFKQICIEHTLLYKTSIFISMVNVLMVIKPDDF